MVLVPLVFVVVAAIGFVYVRSTAVRSRGPADDLKAQIEALKKRIGENPSASPAGPTEDSPEIAAAKSELERLRKKHNLDPPTDASGDVRLQTGGSISTEEYRKALDSLNRSPLTR